MLFIKKKNFSSEKLPKRTLKECETKLKQDQTRLRPGAEIAKPQFNCLLK